MNNERDEEYGKKFGLEELFENLRANLDEHSCKASGPLQTTKTTTRATSRHSKDSSTVANDSLIMLDDSLENKENAAKSRKRLSSPEVDVLLPDTARVSLPTKRRKIKPGTPKTQTKPGRSGACQRLQLSPICECLVSRALAFQLGLLKFVARYARIRSHMAKLVKGLVQTRIKMKESTQTLTNADNLHLQPTQTCCLVCPELDSNADLDTVDVELAECAAALRRVHKQLSAADKEEVTKFFLDRTLKKQFYDSVDLLAQLFGFFGLVTSRAETLRLKLDMLNFDRAQLKQSPGANANTTLGVDVSLYTTTLIHLSKVNFQIKKLEIKAVNF